MRSKEAAPRRKDRNKEYEEGLERLMLNEKLENWQLYARGYPPAMVTRVRRKLKSKNSEATPVTKKDLVPHKHLWRSRCNPYNRPAHKRRPPKKL